jgi:hypothetical protein
MNPSWIIAAENQGTITVIDTTEAFGIPFWAVTKIMSVPEPGGYFLVAEAASFSTEWIDRATRELIKKATAG